MIGIDFAEMGQLRDGHAVSKSEGGGCSDDCAGHAHNSTPLSNALDGRITACTNPFECIFAVLCEAYFVRLVPFFIVCLVLGISYV